MQEAARTNRTADPEFVKACTKLLKDKLTGALTHDQFLEGCHLLDVAAREFMRPVIPSKSSPRDLRAGE